MLSRYYSSPAGGLSEITAVSHICTTAGRALMAASGMEDGWGGGWRCQVLHLAQRCEDDLRGLSLPGCREREQGWAILLLLNDPALMHTHIRTHFFQCLEGCSGSHQHTWRPHYSQNQLARYSNKPHYKDSQYDRHTYIRLQLQFNSLLKKLTCTADWH